MENIERGKRLLALHQARKVLAEAEHLLEVLPQGRGSTLNADMVDGLHAAEIIAEAVSEVTKRIMDRIRAPGGGGGEGKTLSFSELLDTIADAQMPNALLLDGSRAMTGDLFMQSHKVRWDTDDPAEDLYITVDPATWRFLFKSTDGYFYDIEAYGLYSEDWTCTALGGAGIIRGPATGKLYIKTGGGSTIMTVDSDNTDCTIGFLNSITGKNGTATLRTHPLAASHVILQSHTGGAYQTCIDLVGGVAKMDAISEITPGAGVTLDGVLCKDNVIPNSAYPNALLLDGSRLMAGDFVPDGNYTRRIGTGGAAWLSALIGTLYLNTLQAETNPGSIWTKNEANAAIWFRTIFGGAQVCAKLISLGANNGAFQIDRGGDIVGLAGKTLTYDNIIVNTDIVPDEDGGANLGSAALPFNQIHSYDWYIGTSGLVQGHMAFGPSADTSFTPPLRTDANRGAAGNLGRVIFNTDDGMPNYDDGTNWRDINGNIT